MSSVPNSLSKLKWDNIGIAASTLCVVHCVLLPIALAFAPTVAHFLPGSEVIHRILAYLLAAVGLIAFWAGYKVHPSKAGSASPGYWNSRRHGGWLCGLSTTDPCLGGCHHCCRQFLPDCRSLLESHPVPFLSSLCQQVVAHQ
jgi:hypothetical protein